jgi:hypothetical protein
MLVSCSKEESNIKVWDALSFEQRYEFATVNDQPEVLAIMK